jgi:methionine-gamma-lyase
MKNKSYYHKSSIENHKLSPETLMVGYGFDPQLSEGSVKPPVYLSSTFVFKNAEQGKDFFDFASGRRIAENNEAGLVYSRFNNPNMEIVEDRLAVFEDTDSALVFSSGMSAIATTILAYARPGDVMVHSQPLYGGTEVLFAKVLSEFNIKCVSFANGISEDAMSDAIKKAQEIGRVAIIYIETPSNPMNTMVDIELLKNLRNKFFAKVEEKPLIVCDNTLLGPVYQKPLALGADISIYSLTKYAGGHSDLVAGAAVGLEDKIKKIRQLRGAMGTNLDPHTAWMLSRSLETLTIRMRAANEGAIKVASFLKDHKSVDKVFYPEFEDKNSDNHRIYKKQCQAAGSTFSFNIKGGRAEAFKFLNALKIFKLAVSLGGTESLVCHPATTVHSGVPEEVRLRLGITEATIRLSIGIENADDLIFDLNNALSKI